MGYFNDDDDDDDLSNASGSGTVSEATNQYLNDVFGKPEAEVKQMSNASGFDSYLNDKFPR